MDLRMVSDDALLKRTKELALQEREILIHVLHHLREIGRRRLFSDLGYGSLYIYCVEHLGYSNDQAYRRISAARLLTEVPEVETKIVKGALNVTTLSMAQTFFRQAEKAQRSRQENLVSLDAKEKLNILSQLDNKSTREAEKILMKFSGDLDLTQNHEKVRAVGEDTSELKIFVNNAVLEKIKTLKGLLAHSHPNISLNELFDMLCDLGISKWDKAKKNSRTHQNYQAKYDEPRASTCDTNSFDGSQKIAAPKVKRIFSKMRKNVWKHADSKCEKCGSKFALHVDHRQPLGMGGSDEASNLRLLCRSCNQRAAINSYGMKHMGRWLRSPRKGYRIVQSNDPAESTLL